ncbi:MAG TPA: type 4a pilus biogenesis protein PilO [Thermoanaerobaculia bacterium]|nr:type 4a pilus biogenesis protein PilO [Thermoanaerobaculia bacterium]
MALKTGLEGKPWYFGLGAGLFVGLLLFAVGYWRALQPMRDDYDSLERRLSELQNKLQEGRAAKQELPKFREEVRQLELELDKLLRILPARRNTPDLMRRIRSLAEQGDFTLKRFNPGTLTDKEFFSEWPIEVDLDGSYHNLALLFDRVSRFSRIINIEDLTVQALPAVKSTKDPNAANPRTITARFIARTFVYKEPSPEDAANDKTKPGAKGKPAGGKPAASEEGPAGRIRSGTAGPPGGPE